MFEVFSLLFSYSDIYQIIADKPSDICIFLKTFTYKFTQLSMIAQFKPMNGKILENHAIKMSYIYHYECALGFH